MCNQPSPTAVRNPADSTPADYGGGGGGGAIRWWEYHRTSHLKAEAVINFHSCAFSGSISVYSQAVINGFIKKLEWKKQLYTLQISFKRNTKVINPRKELNISSFPGRITIYLNLDKEKYTFVLCAVNRTACFSIHFMYLYIRYM